MQSYTYDQYPPRSEWPRQERWAHYCGEFLGDVAASIVAAEVRALQSPFVAGFYMLGSARDSFLRVSEDIGDAVGRNFGRFIGVIIGSLTASVFDAIASSGTALFSLAIGLFTTAASPRPFTEASTSSN